ncbi:MAG: phenylalanine--tRNA ligase subunit beta [Candidatus Omnitrophica bacterium]|nr:phenylalanine--tRNA ligase subunit beta [Candidatus Omnitrophota bacterium]
MKVSYSWLKSYVDVNIDPRKLAHLLTMAGINVASCDNIEGEYVFELEITANRSDCLSILGVAREAAAILGKKLSMPRELRIGVPAPRKSGKPCFRVTVKEPDLCPRYTARIIRNLEVKSSPEWLKERILSAGLRPVNNIVDITNFVLLETGQPMHAFDFDRIKGGITVRQALKNEKIITIDNTTRTCEDNTLVIADEMGPIAIAGIMGGLETEVSGMTKNILLESAFFDSISVRRTSRVLGIGSESSYRFERRIDNGMVLKASNRASALISELAGGTAGDIIDIGDKTPYSKSIDFNPHVSDSLLGVSIGKSKAVSILKSLGFSVKNKKDSVKVTVPSFRQDVKNAIDLTEEIARIYGYEKIPVTIPPIIGATKIQDFTGILRGTIREALTRLGLYEIITYSLVNKDSVKDFGIYPESLVVIKNPLSIDQEIMRPTLMPGMLGVISHNMNRKAKGLSLFEAGKIYREDKDNYIEEETLSIALTGVMAENWKGRKEDFDFFHLKGIFEELLNEFAPSCEVIFKKENMPVLKKGTSTGIICGNERVGYLGEVCEPILKKFGIEKKVFYGELCMDRLCDKLSIEKNYTPYTRYPSVTRDVSLILGRDITSYEITKIIKETGGELVKGLSLIDFYKGKQIPDGKHGLLYRIEYRSDEKTLEDEEVERIHTLIKETLRKKLNVSFR